MGSDWETTTIADCAADEPYSTQIGPFGNKIKAEIYTDSGAPVLRGINVNQGRFHDDDFVFVSEDYAREELNKFEARANDILLVHKGSLGRIGIIPENSRYDRYIMGNSMMKVQCNPEKVLPKFLYYWLSSQFGTAYLLSRVSQVGVPQIQRPLSTLREAEFPKPPIPVQEAIVEQLDALDSKIELNRRMNRTLEAMAQAIFKSWFVDFEPVKAKAAAKATGASPAAIERAAMATIAGRSIEEAIAQEGYFDDITPSNRESLAQTAALFPDAFQASELGEIPAGWRLRPLANCTTKIGSGSTPRGGAKAYVETGVRLVRSQNVLDSSFKWDGIVCITDEAARKLKGVTLTERDVLINITGDSILRSCVVDRSALPARVNQHVAIIRPKDEIPTHYLHQYIVRPEYKLYLLGFDAGGSRMALTKGHLEQAEVVVPTTQLLRRFDKLTAPSFERIHLNNLESRTLAQLRDTLLPKLLSGELTISEVESQSEEALA